MSTRNGKNARIRIIVIGRALMNGRSWNGMECTDSTRTFSIRFGFDFLFWFFFAVNFLHGLISVFIGGCVGKMGGGGQCPFNTIQ